MENTKGPYGDELGFERWYNETSSFQKQITDATTIAVHYLPLVGWGYVIVVAGVVVNGRYDWDWSAKDAKEAALKALPETSW
jgi:hypothetical protein